MQSLSCYRIFFSQKSFSHCQSLLVVSYLITVFLFSVIQFFLYSLAINLSSGKSSSTKKLPTISVLIPYQLSNQNLYITPKKGISTLDTSLLDSAVPLCIQVTRGSCSMRLLLKNYLSGPQRVIQQITHVSYCVTD